MATKKRGMQEAREFLAKYPEGLAGNRFDSAEEALRYVDALYAAGAVMVAVDGFNKRGTQASTLVVTLPEDEARRAALVALYNAEVDAYGEDFGGEEAEGHELTREEAVALGHPELEGEFAGGDMHVRDGGQPELRFWWD